MDLPVVLAIASMTDNGCSQTRRRNNSTSLQNESPPNDRCQKIRKINNGPRCKYVFRRGNERGQICGNKSQDNYPVCKVHRPTKQGKKIISKFERDLSNFNSNPDNKDKNFKN